MSERLYTPEHLRQIVQKIASNGSLAAWAREHGLSRGGTHDVKTGRRIPGEKTAAALGFRPVTRYVRLTAYGGGGKVTGKGR